MKSERENILEVVNAIPEASKYFSRVKSGDIFPSDPENLKHVFQDLRVSPPKEIIAQYEPFGMSILAKYITVVMPESFSNDLLKTIFMIIDKLDEKDLNNVVILITKRLKNEQRELALYYFPDCIATFEFLGTLLMTNPDLFMNSFQRIFSSYQLVPSSIKPYIISCLRKSMQSGPARTFLQEIVDIVSSHGKNIPDEEDSPLSVVMSALNDTYPDCVCMMHSYEMMRLFKGMVKRVVFPKDGLEVLMKTKTPVILNFSQMSKFIVECPSLLFDYIETLPEDEAVSTWYLLIVKSATDIKNVWDLVNLYSRFLAELRKNPNLLAVIQPSQCMEWFAEYFASVEMGDGVIALLGVYLIMLRCFDELSRKAFEETKIVDCIHDIINQAGDKEAIAKVVFWAMDPGRECPFSITFSACMDDIPPPSAVFVFNIIPSILQIIIRVAITCSTPVDQPQQRTPLRILDHKECTHSKVNLMLNTDDNENEDENDGEVFEDQNEETTVCTGDIDDLLVQPFLKFVLAQITQMYEKEELLSFLYPISSSKTLLPLLPFAFRNTECFVFLSRALGLSCPFPVFQEFFEHISSDFKQTIKFLSLLAEYSQIVTDFLYVTSSIPLVVSCPIATIVMWVRPLTESTLVTLTGLKQAEIKIRITKDQIITNNGLSMQLPPKIGGWVMVAITWIDVYNVVVSANLVTLPKTLIMDVQNLKMVTIGDQNSHFDLQSVRMFRTILSQRDLLYLFSIGPNHQEFLSSSFDALDKKRTAAFVCDNGFISNLYIPFAQKYPVDRKIDSQCFTDLEISLSPPFKNVKHVTRSVSSQATKISVDRRRSYSFLNALHCHGGMHLLLHFIGEVIMKKKDLNQDLWTMMSKLFNYCPIVNSFFEDEHAYALVGHLLWSGNASAKDTINLAVSEFDGKCYLTNPRIIEHWLLKAQVFFCEIPEIIMSLIDSLNILHNFDILQKINAFEKIVDLLCSTSSHSSQFLHILGDFAVKLTVPGNVENHVKLVFDNLMLYHFKFAENQKCTLSSLNTIQMLRILEMLLSKLSDVNVDLELFIPVIITAIPQIQVAIIVLLIKYMKVDYLYPLGCIMSAIQYMDDLKAALFTIVDSLRTDFIRMTACLLYLCAHEESVKVCEQFCSFVSMDTSVSVDKAQIACNHILRAIQVVEQNNNLLHFDDSANISDFISIFMYKILSQNKVEMVQKFFVAVSSIPNVPLHRLGCLSLFILTKIMQLIIDNPVGSSIIENALENICLYGSYIVHKVRLTPGAIDEYFMGILCAFSQQVVNLAREVNTTECIQNLMLYLITMSHLELSYEFIARISQVISEVPKITKHKRYYELIDRLESYEMMTPTKFVVPFDSELEKFDAMWQTGDEKDRIELFSLSCRSIHHQTKVAMMYESNDTESDFVIDLWYRVFHILQCPGSGIYKDCPTKWILSDRTSSFQQRTLLRPMNPSIDKAYEDFWAVKYGCEPPNIRLKLREVVQYTSISLHNASDVKFSSHAIRISGISNFDGVLVLTDSKIRFYQLAERNSSQFCEDLVTISISKIVHVRLKPFMHQPTGIEIMCSDFICYLFAFDSVNIRDSFADVIASCGIKIAGSVSAKELESMTKKWIDCSISNFDYLLYLNTVSGRSWNDFTQYPIIPWVLKDYSSETLDLASENVYRDFRYPVFAQTSPQQEQCLLYYRTTAAIGSNPHCSPNYVSNVGSALYFLIRMEPFTSEEISFQSGSLDVADRTFQSFDISYKLMTSPGKKAALELVPEFYFHPEVLKNANSIKFPESLMTNRTVGDVILPKWAPSHRDFVRKMRSALESPIVSRRLHEWIDLIWGFRRRGDPALERFNIFQHTVFEFNPDEVMDDIILLRALKDQIQNCGQAAEELFKAPHPKRQEPKRLITPIGELVFHLEKRQPERQTTPVKLVSNALELNGAVAHSFSSEIAVTCFDLTGTTLVTGHAMPIVNLWKLHNNHITLVTPLRCHLAQITSIAIFDLSWAMLAAGHEDGCVSVFSTNPLRFIRTFVSPRKTPVTMIRMSSSNGDILIVQDRLVTLWSVNGELVCSVEMENRVIDAQFTEFLEGTNPNFMFLLCEGDAIFTLNTSDMNIVSELVLKRKNAVRIHVNKDDQGLLVVHADGWTSSWKLR